MRIPRIDDALQKCEVHISSKNIDGEIADLLTRSLLILICSEFERKIKEMVNDRCESISDRQVRQFAQSSTEKMFRGLWINELAGLLGHFSSEYKQQFGDSRDKEAIDAYSSIITNRNKIAHGEESVATFQDVKLYYEKAHVVLDWFQSALRSDTVDPGAQEENA